MTTYNENVPNFAFSYGFKNLVMLTYWSDIEEKEVKKILNEFHKARGRFL